MEGGGLRREEIETEGLTKVCVAAIGVGGEGAGSCYQLNSS